MCLIILMQERHHSQTASPLDICFALLFSIAYANFSLYHMTYDCDGYRLRKNPSPSTKAVYGQSMSTVLETRI